VNTAVATGFAFVTVSINSSPVCLLAKAPALLDNPVMAGRMG
jgi:hypothetical protein